MTLSAQVVGLSQRVDGLSQRVDKVDQRLDKLEQRFDRFEARVEERFDAVDRRFDRFEASVDERFNDMKRHSNVIAEASRDDFLNLYDLLQAHMERMDARTDTLAVTLRAEMTLGDDALDSRLTVLERHQQTRRGRTRH